MALSSETFWKKQFEHPAMLIRTHIRKLAQDVDGDAKVKNPTASSSTAITAEIDRSTGKRPHNLVEATSSHPAPVKAPLLAITNGPETVNGKGFGFCDCFNTGRCNAITKGDARCPKDTTKRHQCWLCRGLDHGAHNCPLAGKPVDKTTIVDNKPPTNPLKKPRKQWYGGGKKGQKGGKRGDQ